MKRMWIDVDDGIEYQDILKLLSDLDLDPEFIKGMGIEEK